MKLQLSFIISLTAILFLFSCEKEKTSEDIWRENNEAEFAKIGADSQYSKLESESGHGFILYRVNKTGDGEKSPYFTESAKVKFTGWFKQDWSKPDIYTDDTGNIINNKIIFDTTGKNDIPRTLSIRNSLDGVATALQHMKVGDEWEIWIPWALGYGDIASGVIPAYTTLGFVIELIAIIE